jgi:hypothetical protein
MDVSDYSVDHARGRLYIKQLIVVSFLDDHFRYHLFRLVKARLEGLAGALKAGIGAGTIKASWTDQIFFSFLST